MKEWSENIEEHDKTESQWVDFFKITGWSPEGQGAEAIKTAKSILAKFFVFGDQYGHRWDSDIFSADLSKGPENIDVSVKLELNVWEKKEVPEDRRDFNLTIQIRGARLEKIPSRPNFSTHHRLVFKDVIFVIGEKSVTLNEIIPEVEVEITDEVIHTESYDPDTKRIQLHHLSDLEDIFSFLHEAGHAIDEKKREVKDWRQDMDKNLGLSERNAWTEALKVARKYGIPITDFFLNHKLRRCLESYEREAKTPISSESRKKERNKTNKSKYQR